MGSMSIALANQIYFVLSSLRTKTIRAFEKHIEIDSIEELYKHHCTTIFNLFSLLATGQKIEGVPLNYCKCFAEHANLWESVLRPDSPTSKLASKLFFAVPKTNRAYTPCAKQLIKVLFGSANSSGLIKTQRLQFLLVWLTGFRLLKNDMEEPCSSFACVGPPDTGKSEGFRRTLECVPSCLVVSAESQSALAWTAFGSDYDFSIIIRDELKTISGAPGSGDQQTNDSDKLLQSLLSQKYVIHRTKVRVSART